VKLYRLKMIEQTPVSLFITKGWVELADAGHVDPNSILVGGSYPAVYAEERGKIIGAITYFGSEGDLSLNINMGYVLPKYRRRGVYTRMFEEIKTIGRERGFKWISTHTSPKNTAIVATNEKLGRRVIAWQWRIDL
jgi:GNAT superfamily N-acetyltransferase